MRFLLISLLSLSFTSYALDFEVIGDFRNADEIENWSIESEEQNPKANLISADQKALFFSNYQNQNVELTRAGNWDFSKFTHFMADVVSDGQSYNVSLTDSDGLSGDYKCVATFKTNASALVSTIQIPVEEFECGEKNSVLNLKSIKKVGVSPVSDLEFSLGIESFWMEKPDL